MRTIIMLLMLLAPVTLSAQHRKFNPAQFRAEMVDFLTSYAQLSESEAATFFPVYDSLQAKKRTIRSAMRSLRHQNPVSDDECRQVIEKRDSLGIATKQLERDYHSEFMKILSPSKLYKVLDGESKFIRRSFLKFTHKQKNK